MVEGLGSDEEMLITMHNDWRKVYSKFAVDIARFLIEWGFLVSAQQKGGGVRVDPKEVARYMSAASAHSLAAILEERQHQEQEKASGQRG